MLVMLMVSIPVSAGTDFINVKISSIYVRNEAPKSVYIKISPTPTNCGGPDYLLTNDATWDDYTNALYSYALAAHVSGASDLQIEISCDQATKRIIRIMKANQ
ncbi:hypothetical protein [Aliikangiella coralliicola]|uniref:Uncharacterized protein n=1 Tax=Aliikangiella coralliicola TaxID=2592383 RepID=A0A545U4U8_9GAMM|nr:hypothetical protein [Aliikangiella coralliicola]TQV84497.1 hypothetical protein FLL46_23065 [Aliikangiella coralliicola]